MQPDLFVGVDLGQAADYTATAVVERSVDDPPMLYCRHLERFPLGTRYPTIVEKVVDLLALPLLEGATLVVDATGVGRAVTDLFREADLRPVAVVVTAGDAITRTAGYLRVPKRDLVAAVQAPLQEKRLKFAEGMPLISTLIQEMLAFKVKITASAHDTYGAWREGEHDDLIFAVMLACWQATQPRTRVTMSANPFYDYPSDATTILPSEVMAPVHSNTDAHLRWAKQHYCPTCAAERAQAF